MPEDLSTVAYRKLCDMIAEPEWDRGGRLPPEDKLAELCGVSRPVLRRALASLKTEGRITSRRGSGNFVAPRAPQAPPAPRAPGIRNVTDLEKCLRYRLILETGIAGEAAENARPEAIERMQAAISRMDAGQPGGSLFEADFEFHHALAEATNNPFFLRALLDIRPQLALAYQMGRALRDVPLYETSRRVTREHMRILEAVRKHDPQAARTAMHDHLEAGIRRFFGEDA